MEKPYVKDVLVAYLKQHYPSMTEGGTGHYLFIAISPRMLTLPEVAELQRELGYPMEAYGSFDLQHKGLGTSAIGGMRMMKTQLFEVSWVSFDSCD